MSKLNKEWYHNDNGKVSFMRIAGMMVVIVFSGIAITAIIMIFLDYVEAIPTLGICSGMIGLVFGGKILQKKSENGNGMAG